MFNKKICAVTSKLDQAETLLRPTIKIMVIDDEPEILELITETIRPLIKDFDELAEVVIEKKENGLLGLKHLERAITEQSPHDIVLCDIEMPMVNGYAVCEKVRKESRFDTIKNIPFMFISAQLKEETENHIKAFRSGADDIHIKPLNPELLYLQVQRLILNQIKIKKDQSKSQLLEEAINHYVHRQLVNKILNLGKLDTNFYDSYMGVIFGDIVDSTLIAQKLPALETGLLLNGIFCVVQDIVEKHNGHYNKSIGDGFMIHFGGPLDNSLGEKNHEELIAERIFETCIELQRTMVKFNMCAYESPSPESQKEIAQAYTVLSRLAKKDFIGAKLRLGAHMGSVNFGDFGPAGFKHPDIIGNIVNMASRLESTAPPMGIRLHQSICEHLINNRKIESYIKDFRDNAINFYKNASNEDIFKFKTVTAKNFSERLPTFTIEPLYNLPEIIKSELEILLDLGPEKITQILDYIRLYRGNMFVLNAIQKLLEERQINIRYQEIAKLLKTNFPNIENQIFQKDKILLYEVLKMIGKLQDKIEELYPAPKIKRTEQHNFSYQEYINDQLLEIEENYEHTIKKSKHETYIFKKLIPGIFAHIETSLLEYFYKKSYN